MEGYICLPLCWCAPTCGTSGPLRGGKRHERHTGPGKHPGDHAGGPAGAHHVRPHHDLHAGERRLQPGGQHLCGPGERPGLPGPQLRLPGAADDGGLLHRHWSGLQRHLRPAPGGGEGGGGQPGGLSRIFVLYPVLAAVSGLRPVWSSPVFPAVHRRPGGGPGGSGVPHHLLRGVHRHVHAVFDRAAAPDHRAPRRLYDRPGFRGGAEYRPGPGVHLRPGYGGGRGGGGHGDRTDLRGLHRLFPAVAHPPGVLRLLPGLPAQRSPLGGDAAHRRPRRGHAVPVQLYVPGAQSAAHPVVPDGGVRAGGLLQDSDLCVYAHLRGEQRPHPHPQLQLRS